MLDARKQLNLIASVAEARDQDDLFRRMKAAALACGFDYVLFGLEIRRPFAPPMRHISSAYPEAYQLLYQDRGFEQIDPTVAHCQLHTQALVWSDGMYVTPQSREVMEESRSHGLEHGFSVPVHESATVASMLSLARDKPFENDAEKELAVASGIALANAVHVVTRREVVPALQLQAQPKLTPRERECLKWLAEGKSNSVIADILNISEPAVIFHVGNLYTKLKVSTRQQAAVVALQLGMLG